MTGYIIINKHRLRRILWADVLLGSGTGLVGLAFRSFFSQWFGLSEQVIMVISIITLMYSLFALLQVSGTYLSVTQIRILIYANWFWTLVSVALLFVFYHRASQPGVAFLVLQVVVVGALAWLEGKQLAKPV